MPQDPIRQLLDLVAVHGFYLTVLEQVIGEPVPVPRGAAAEDQKGTPVDQSISILRRWLNILDMAVAPPMFRDALKDTLEQSTGEALLRYYVLKTSHTDTDRDKCDFINTHLYRSFRRQKGLPEAPSDVVEIAPYKVLEYEGEIYSMLGDVEPPELPQEHFQLAREFEHLREQVDEFTHFDSIMDSGIIGRVREIKASFGRSFYHPHVLSEVAFYNAFFGRKFDELFHRAASDIKTFAQNVTSSGASLMTRIADEVTVQELADVQEERILHEEYGKARDKLRKIAQFKKVVDTKRKGRYTGPPPTQPPTVLPMPEPRQAHAAPFTGAAVSRAAPAPAFAAPGAVASSDVVPTQRIEENKIDAASDVIRNFVAVADRSFSSVVPLRNCKILLTPHEIDAFRNPFLDEKSFRADYALLVRRIVGLIAAMMIELADYQQKRTSAYLWKQHADSLKYLLNKAQSALADIQRMRELCEQRGLAEKVKVLQSSAERLATQMQEVARQLQA